MTRSVNAGTLRPRLFFSFFFFLFVLSKVTKGKGRFSSMCSLAAQRSDCGRDCDAVMAVNLWQS